MAATKTVKEKDEAFAELLYQCGRVVDEVSAYNGGLVHWGKCVIHSYCQDCDDEDCEYLEHCDCDFERFLKLKRALVAYREAVNGTSGQSGSSSGVGGAG